MNFIVFGGSKSEKSEKIDFFLIFGGPGGPPKAFFPVWGGPGGPDSTTFRGFGGSKSDKIDFSVVWGGPKLTFGGFGGGSKMGNSDFEGVRNSLYNFDWRSQFLVTLFTFFIKYLLVFESGLKSIKRANGFLGSKIIFLGR